MEEKKLEVDPNFFPDKNPSQKKKKKKKEKKEKEKHVSKTLEHGKNF